MVKMMKPSDVDCACDEGKNENWQKGDHGGFELACMEKKFVEVNTKEQLITSTIGIYASKKDEDRYVPLQNPQQILFAPFE